MPMARTVAVIGASNDRRKYGNKAVRAFLNQGYTVYPVNPHEPLVEGLATFRSVLEIPGPVEMATVYVQPDVGLQVLDELAGKGIREVWFNPGSESAAIVARAKVLGLDAVLACSIMGVGERPSFY